jgi:hypothetical protein
MQITRQRVERSGSSRKIERRRRLRRRKPRIHGVEATRNPTFVARVRGSDEVDATAYDIERDGVCGVIEIGVQEGKLRRWRSHVGVEGAELADDTVRGGEHGKVLSEDGELRGRTEDRVERRALDRRPPSTSMRLALAPAERTR